MNINNLLIEIRTEEIPAGYIEPALKALSSKLFQKMTEVRIDHGDAKTYGTPRRLAVKVENVAAKQTSLSTEVIGPPKRIGFNEQGSPTVAAEKFAEKAGVPVNRLKIKMTKKGAYLCATKTEKGLATKTLLKNILPDVILATPFPKKMRWADQSLEFARPIHSVLALFGEKIIPFDLANIKSGRFTDGHAFMHHGRIKILSPGRYIPLLRDAHVLVDTEERKKAVASEIARVAGDLGGRVLPDEALLDTVNNLVEYPAAVGGRFDTKFLELPREILITSMHEHQKYFAVIDEHDNLMPCFIAVNNTLAKDMSLVAKGHERVLRARLADAQFFYRSDLEVSFDGWVERLKGVLFQADLGSMYEKVMRVQKLSEFMVDQLASALPHSNDKQLRMSEGEQRQTDPIVYESDLKGHVSRAAILCKADLVSQIVVEFPKLQGVMGRVYAAIAGEPDSVATAIEEHYRPIYSGGPLPEMHTGALLSIADKIDSICGCFSVGLIPTGASDPYALRRQGIGIAQIMLDKDYLFSLRRIIEKSLNLFDHGNVKEMSRTTDKIVTFLKNRMVHLLAEEGFSKDVIAAVVNVSVDKVPEVWRRVHALEKLKSAPDFEPLATAFKRVVNIIKKARHEDIKTGDEAGDVQENLFQHASEFSLFSAYQEVKERVEGHIERGSFDKALHEIASLRNPVDAFFDGVMVMTDDRQTRYNRLSLLGYIATLFEKFADFSKIQISSNS